MFRRSLDCGGGDCENCSSCCFGGGDPYKMYQDYIDGKKEISEINAEYRAKYLHGYVTFAGESLLTGSDGNLLYKAGYTERLIQLDYDIPLKNFNYEKYRLSICHGSIALTAAGQAVIEQLEIKGI